MYLSYCSEELGVMITSPTTLRSGPSKMNAQLTQISDLGGCVRDILLYVRVFIFEYVLSWIHNMSCVCGCYTMHHLYTLFHYFDTYSLHLHYLMSDLVRTYKYYHTILIYTLLFHKIFT